MWKEASVSFLLLEIDLRQFGICCFFEEKKLWLDREIVPVSNSGFESAMLFSDMHWQTHLCKKKIILHTTCTRHRWGVISVGSISSFLIISIDVPSIAFQNVTEFHSSWTCQIYPCIIHYRMLLNLILHQFSATHSWNTTRFYLKNSFPVKDLDVGWRKLSSFLENEKKNSFIPSTNTSKIYVQFQFICSVTKTKNTQRIF